MLRIFKTSFITTVILIIFCGLIYPLSMTGIASIIFPYQAEGSLVKVQDKTIGSKHIGQTFNSDYYLHGRISAVNYNVDRVLNNVASPVSGGSNMSNSNTNLTKRIEDSKAKLSKENNDKIPVDLITASGSGLDPNITLTSAKFQLNRIAKYSKLDKSEILKIFEKHIYKNSDYEFVNVLEINKEIFEKMKNN